VLVEAFIGQEQQLADLEQRVLFAATVVSCWTRRRTSSIAALASFDMCKWSTTSCALGSPTCGSVSAAR